MIAPKTGIKTLLLLSVTLGIIMSSMIFVFGVQGASITLGQSGRGNFSFTGNGTLVNTEPGNVTYMGINGDSITTHWAGFYGNISGNLTLEDASGNVFYDWAGIGTPSGEVFASNSSFVLWSTIACANSTQIDAINNYLDFSLGGQDTVENTYNSRNHVAFVVAGVNIVNDTCNSTSVYSAGVKDPSLFRQIMLSDNNTVPIFTTLINSSSASFQNQAVDFQLLTGVKVSTITPLYFFIELG